MGWSRVDIRKTLRIAEVPLLQILFRRAVSRLGSPGPRACPEAVHLTVQCARTHPSIRTAISLFPNLSPFPTLDGAEHHVEILMMTPHSTLTQTETPQLTRAVWSDSPTWRYLARKRFLPSAIIEAASAAGVLREGPAGSAWFAHFNGAGSVAHVDIRGPTYKGSLAGGAKSLFRLPPSAQSFPRLVLAEAAIDALSVAAIESLRADTLYAASGGGMGPGTIAALEALLTAMATLPGALFCSATDANGPGDRFAERHRSLAEKFSVPFARLRPLIEGGDWNDVLRARSQHQGSTS